MKTQSQLTAFFIAFRLICIVNVFVTSAFAQEDKEEKEEKKKNFSLIDPEDGSVDIGDLLNEPAFFAHSNYYY